MHLNFQPLREGVDYRYTNTMETPGNLVAITAKLSPRVEGSQHHFYGRTAHLGVFIYGNSPPIVADHYHPTGPQDNIYPITVAGQGFIDAVVHHFIDKMMKPAATRTPDVHSRRMAHSFQTF